MTQQTIEAKDKQEKAFTVENVPGGLIKALSSFTAAQKGRWDLQCVHVEENSMAAADGSVLAKVTLPESLGPETLTRINKPSLRKRKCVTLTRKNGSLTAEETNGAGSRTETYSTREGNYPDYENVIPSGKGAESAVAKVSYLKKTLDLLDSAGFRYARITVPESKGVPFRIDGTGPNHSAGKGTEETQVTVVISPVLEDE